MAMRVLADPVAKDRILQFRSVLDKASKAKLKGVSLAASEIKEKK